MNGESDNIRDTDGDAVPAELAEEGSELSMSDRVQLLQQSLQQWTKNAAEAKERYLRTAADFDNYRKRMQRDMTDFRKYANEQMALELLTVVDHLGLALKHAGEPGESVQGLQQGVSLVYRQLCDVLEKFGIKRFAAEGESFDPAKHEAVMQVDKDDMPENTVVQVLQDGYLYHEKILRHAKVGVSKRSKDAAQQEQAQQAPREQKAYPHEVALPEEMQETASDHQTAPNAADDASPQPNGPGDAASNAVTQENPPHEGRNKKKHKNKR